MKAQVVILSAAPADLLPPDQTILDRSDVEMVVATTSRSILHELRTRGGRLLVVGADLPDQSLEDLVRDIRASERLRSTSILLLLPRTDADRGDRLLRLGANDLVLTPADGWEVDEKASRLLAVAARSEVRVNVQIVVEDVRGVLLAARSCDLSASGIALETDGWLEVGEETTLRFALPGRSQDIEVQGKVVRQERLPRDRRRYGIRFLNLAQRDRESVERFVNAERMRRHLRSALR